MKTPIERFIEIIKLKEKEDAIYLMPIVDKVDINKLISEEKQFFITDVMHLLTEYEKFASGDNYIGNKQLIDKQIKEFIEVNCA